MPKLRPFARARRDLGGSIENEKRSGRAAFYALFAVLDDFDRRLRALETAEKRSRRRRGKRPYYFR